MNLAVGSGCLLPMMTECIVMVATSSSLWLLTVLPSRKNYVPDRDQGRLHSRSRLTGPLVF